VFADGMLEAGKVLEGIEGAGAEVRVAKIKDELARLNGELNETQRIKDMVARAGPQGYFASLLGLTPGRSIDTITAEIKSFNQALEAAGIQTLKKKNDAAIEADEMLTEKQIANRNKATEKELENIKKLSDERMKTYAAIQEGMDAVNKQYEKEQRAIEKTNRMRLQGIIDAETALERLYARQAAGFNGEGSNNSLQGSIDALEIAVRGAAARMGGL